MKSSRKKKIYFKDRNIIDNLYNKIIRKEIVLGTIYEKNKLKIKEYIGVENLFDSFKLNNAGFVFDDEVDQYDEIHFTTYYKYGDFVKSSIKNVLFSSFEKENKIY